MTPSTDDLYLMSHLGPEATGIDGAVIWVAAGRFGRAEHGPRIVIALGDKGRIEGLREAASVTITDPARGIDGVLPSALAIRVAEFVRVNRDILLRYWMNEVSTRQMIEGTRGV